MLSCVVSSEYQQRVKTTCLWCRTGPVRLSNNLSLTIIFLQFPYCYSRVPSGEVDPAAADKDCVGEDPDVDQDGDGGEVLLPLHLPLVTQDPQGETGQHWQR